MITINSLQAVALLRRQAVTVAEAELARRLAAEGEAARVEQAAIDALHREEQVALSLTADDVAVEAFAAWLPVGRRALAQARAARARAAEAVAISRAGLAVARTALESIERLVANRQEAARQVRLRQEQAALQDLSCHKAGSALA